MILAWSAGLGYINTGYIPSLFAGTDFDKHGHISQFYKMNKCTLAYN